jgi:DNA-binding transcriptional LysR family regulator
VIRDSGSGGVDAGWLGAEQRWTVSHMSTSVHAAVMGLGFAWYPEEIIADELANGSLQRLPLQEGEERFADLYLVYAEADYTGPAARRFGEILRNTCANLKDQQEQSAAHY